MPKERIIKSGKIILVDKPMLLIAAIKLTIIDPDAIPFKRPASMPRLLPRIGLQSFSFSFIIYSCESSFPPIVSPSNALITAEEAEWLSIPIEVET